MHVSEYGHSHNNTSVRMWCNLVPNNLLFSLENRLCLKTTVFDLCVKALLCVSEESKVRGGLNTQKTGIISCLLFLCRTVRKLDEKKELFSFVPKTISLHSSPKATILSMDGVL